MSTRSLLISYAGYPYTFNSLMPDNGLANLAGALLCAGHETLVLDYGTVENVRRMMPKDLSSEAKRVFASMASKLAAGEKLGDEDVQSVTRFEREQAEAGEKHCSRLYDEICSEIERFKPHFVGFKLWNGDGFSGSIRIAKRLKSTYKSVKLFAGGPHVDLFGGSIYRESEVFDCLAYGEGEETILQLAEFARGHRELGEVNNIIYRDGSGSIVTTESRRIADLNTLLMPCYDEAIYPAMKGDNKIKIVVLDESRGCSFGCHFCIHPFKSGPKVRSKKASRIVEEMRRAIGQTGSRAFRYAGSSTPPGLAKDVADLIVGDGLRISYAGFGNPMNARPAYFGQLKASGCHSLFFGLESGSEQILTQAMGKAVKPGKMREILEASKRAGIFTVVSIIFPAPFETEETEQETLSFLREVRPDSALVLFPAVYPATKWATQKEKFGFVFDDLELTNAAMNYKAKTLFPMEFWNDLPYGLSGRGFRAIMNETGRFTSLLEKEGILTSVSDDLALMAHLGGYRGGERRLRDLGRLWFFAGDAESIQRFVEAVNANAKSLNMPEHEMLNNPEKRK